MHVGSDATACNPGGDVCFISIPNDDGQGDTTSTRAYVTDIGSNSNSVFVIDTGTNTVIATIPVGLFPLSIAITPDGTRAYVTNSNSATISVIDTATNSVIATIPIGFHVFDIAFTPDGVRAYAGGEQDSNGAIVVIDTATNTAVTTIPVCRFP